MSEHRAFEELVALDALGALDAPERARLEAHLASGCEECLSASRDAKRVADVLPAAALPSVPNESVRVALMARVRDEARPPSGNPHQACHFLACARRGCRSRGRAHGGVLRSLARELACGGNGPPSSRRRGARTTSRLLAFRHVPSKSRGVSRWTRRRGLRAFLDRENRRLFLYVENLPPLPSDRTYQIWLLVDGTPVSVGTFDVDADGAARLDGKPLPAFEPTGSVAVAVTVEPAGGVPQPTGEMVLLGS